MYEEICTLALESREKGREGGREWKWPLKQTIFITIIIKPMETIGHA
jgi:hypothetical protein